MNKYLKHIRQEIDFGDGMFYQSSSNDDHEYERKKKTKKHKNKRQLAQDSDGVAIGILAGSAYLSDSDSVSTSFDTSISSGCDF